MDLEDYMTVKEAAELIGITESYVCQKLRGGELQGKKWTGRGWMVEKESAEKMRENTATTGRPRTAQRHAG